MFHDDAKWNVDVYDIDDIWFRLVLLKGSTMVSIDEIIKQLLTTESLYMTMISTIEYQYWLATVSANIMYCGRYHVKAGHHVKCNDPP